jgi:uncharacterized repeat protein (TIGR03803 family)
MRRNHSWIGGIGILALLALLPVISSGAPSANEGSKVPAATEKVIYSFQGGSDGANPMSDLVLDSAGNLYGTTSAGGTGTCDNNEQNGCGTVFELKRTSGGWQEQVLHRFQGGDDGEIPQAGVIFDSSGNLYGTTTSGGNNANGGTVFQLAPNGKGGWTETILYSFVSGANPASDLVFDANGNLYGTTRFGGVIGHCGTGRGCGTVFELIKQSNGSWAEFTLYQFAGPPSDGGIPSSGVALDSAGNLYGMTVAGGPNNCNLQTYPGCGIVYKLTSDGKGNWTETVLFNFARGNGFAVSPSAGLLVDEDGDRLVGTTLQGGDGAGTIFALKASDTTWKQDVLHRFYESLDGRSPAGQLIKDSQGNLFGATVAGGGATRAGFGGGMVFELQPNPAGPWKETILYDFTGGTDGSNPEAGLVSDGHGHLYGTTLRGGTGTCEGEQNFCGTVYEITP